ncbi:MAG: 30S ribosomal protein S12 methylthiotransferase RimO [Gemmatales bacterium]|nr:30S ribosomal protein S12 methylthiotransferase RimO [Gemmatales bacterium]MDW7995858.1 30S ribosomal protein S12 methylthiotransferase RimO [Gemmatales bacterium]
MSAHRTSRNCDEPKASFAFVSLGCAKNTVDSERMLGLLAQDGFALTPYPEDADIVIVNTCGFIEAARQESLAVIREMVELKERGRVRAVIVAGCLAERWRERLLEEVPGIDALLGVFAREEIAALCTGVWQHARARTPAGDLRKNKKAPRSGRHSLPTLDESLWQKREQAVWEQRAIFRPAPVRPFSDQARLRITPRHYAYLKISEGCDRLCTFCAIPKMRGKHVSKPLEQVLAEAEELVSDGVVELNLVAQDLTYYGLDTHGRPMLAELLRQLEAIEGLRWIRLLYLYPMYITDELLATIAASPKILHYLDIPLQHINDRVLRRMQRRVTRAEIEALVARLRQALPDLVLRTTMIVGFPGETEEEFEELCDFVAQGHFQRLGVFTYSLEPDTPAARLDGHLPEEVKESRRDRLMRIQQEVAFAWAKRQMGQIREVLVDGRDPQDREIWLARSYADAPEIDALVRFRAQRIRAGDLVRVRIVEADGYDLVGELLSHSA